MNKVISYATNKYIKSQELLQLRSIKHGADCVINYGPQHIDEKFVQKNIKILNCHRGAGVWLWKPYIILKTLIESNDGDKILYCDSGMYPIENLNHLFNLTNKERDIVLFQVHNKKIKDWTHNKCLSILNCDVKYYELEQVCGAPQLYTKTENSINFVKELLSFCEIYDAIYDFDMLNHRHDQSILSILSARNDIEIFRDPSQWGNEHPRQNSKYPQIFNLHRGNI